MENSRFKLRIWDYFNVVMVYSDEYKNLADFHKYCQMCIDRGNKMLFMQCTGLKDKNGKLIYEGDILEKYGTKEDTDMQETYGLSWYEVVFVEGEFKKCWRKSEKIFYASKASFQLNFLLNNYHVVDNKFENPELLKQND